MTRIILKYCTILFISGAAFCLVYPLWFSASHVNRGGSCQSNQKQIALGFFMYEQDYDKLPSAIFPGQTVGWANSLQPYLKSYSIFQCPSETNFPQKDPPLPDQPDFTDYCMNRNLSGVKDENINNPAQIIILGDGDGGSPLSTASYAINQLPIQWRTLPDSPIKRHLDGANYAFLDGHVKWVKPEQIAQVPPSKKSRFYTFLLK